MGCGVASFAAYLENYDVRCMSVAPKDEHDAQIQFALERGVSAVVGVMGTQRQPYPANAFDAVHCARCRVPWHADGERLGKGGDGRRGWKERGKEIEGEGGREIGEKGASKVSILCWKWRC